MHAVAKMAWAENEGQDDRKIDSTLWSRLPMIRLFKSTIKAHIFLMQLND